MLLNLNFVSLYTVFLQSKLPKSIKELFPTGQEIHMYNTCSNNVPHIKKHSSSICNSSFLCKSASEWLKLPIVIRNKTTKHIKKSIKKLLCLEIFISHTVWYINFLI